MQKRVGFVTVFIIFLCIAAGLFFISRNAASFGPGQLLERIISPFQKTLYSAFGGILIRNGETAKLRSENENLAKQIVDQQNVVRETKALRDQYDLEITSPKSLLAARVVGMKSFVPGVSLPEEIILDKGRAQHVLVGQTVIVNDNVIGNITKVTESRSLVSLISNKKQSVTGKAIKTNALGIIKGQGNGLLVLENVVLSDTLEKGDLVVTKGEEDLTGTGYPPDLVVGKISSVDKKSSDLFQSAEIESLIDFTRLENVFIITGN